MFFGGIDLMAQTKLTGAEGYSEATPSLPFVVLYMWRDEMRHLLRQTKNVASLGSFRESQNFDDQRLSELWF